MKLILLFVALTITLIGCGQVDDEATLYDTNNSPHQFPQQAIDLLTDLENGKLADAEAITEGFGELYTHHSELLDDADWKGVIEKLGSYFSRQADSLRALGVPAYIKAGEFYQLAAFARPDDRAYRRQAALFSRWVEASEDTTIDLSVLTEGTSNVVEDFLPAIRYFVNGDETDREFYETYLLGPIKDLAASHGLLADSVTAELSPADRELLRAAGLMER